MFNEYIELFDILDLSTVYNNRPLIVTPLNALINNQISILHEHGIKATVLKTRSYTANETDNEECETDLHNVGEEYLAELSLDTSTESNIKQGMFKIIFSHPEAFISCREGRRLFMSSVMQNNVVAYIIDEWHLVEELPLKWCSYAHKIFSDILGEKINFPPGDRKPENCFLPSFILPKLKL